MFKKLAIESVFATILVFIVMGIIALIPINISALQPLENAIEGFDMIDLYYSQLNAREGEFSKNVVLVNIGDANRAEIGELIEYVGFGNPAAIGVDVYFKEPQSTHQDSILANAIKQTPNVVMGAGFDEDENILNQSFLQVQSEYVGVTNFVGTDARYSTIRYFKPKITVGNNSVNALAVELVKITSPSSVNQFLERDYASEAIRFTGNYDAFLHFEKDELLSGDIDPEIFENKVVIIGFMGDRIGDQFDFEDRFYTPLNPVLSGRSVPDMNGMVIHANIVEMILSKNWISRFGLWFTILFTIIITYIHVFLYMFLITKLDYYFDAIAVILQIISTLLLVYLVFVLYHYSNFRIYVTGGLVGIAFSVEILFIYEAAVHSIYKKFNIKSVLIEEE